MIIVDKALQARQDAGDPVRVGVVGAGFAGQGFVAPGAAGDAGHGYHRRRQPHARRSGQGVHAHRHRRLREPCPPAAQLATAIERGQRAITDDPLLVTAADGIECIVEATGEIEFGAHTAVSAIDHGKHLVLLNAELDCTLGPILKDRADAAGVVFTDADGDQPGVIMNLAREAEMMGFTPVVLGNIKSLLDHRRTPETQAGFAANVFQRPKHITSFADGTKIAAEMACVANATGFGVSERGMAGPEAKRVEEAPGLFDAEKLYQDGTGIVDYILGAEPSFGVFLLAYSDSWLHERYMKIYKMGDGPIYTFYRPYHLSPLETPLTVARAVLFNDAAITPKGAPVTDVVALAKFDLKAGTRLDGVGGFTCYGVMENSPQARAENLLPMGLTDGCVLKRNVAQDTPITFDDVELPAAALSDELWQEQRARFG